MLFPLLEHSFSIFLLVAQLVKHPPAMQETRVQSLCWEDPLEKEMSTPLQNSCLGNPMDKGAWQATAHGVTSVGHELVTKPPPIPVTFSRKAPQTALSLGSPHMLPLNLESPLQVSSIQSFSCVQLSVTPWTAACQVSLSITNSQSLLKLMSIESVMPSNNLILCPPLLLPPSIFPSMRIFSNESALLIRWPKYWSFRFNISLSNEYFRTDFL